MMYQGSTEFFHGELVASLPSESLATPFQSVLVRSVWLPPRCSSRLQALWAHGAEENQSEPRLRRDHYPLPYPLATVAL
ncbi:hypothetical protein CC2G_012669 [Coprinopsis cinerea AmutBmut pab1-1]|nr:hypothetical protein CC2G_012669 [Coprinopsis cinerea AmutBmut pab1-1]